MYSLTTDIGELIRIYYENIELGTDEILRMYPGMSRATASTFKKRALKVMTEKNILQWDSRKVNTECAFIAWGLNIADLERRYQKLQKFSRKE